MNDQINALLAETHNSLRDELAAAQQHFERLEQLLERRDSTDIANLNHAARRLRASAQGDWAKVLNEASGQFCERAAVFTVRDGALRLESAGTLEDVSLDQAPAFRAAVDTRDTVVAMRTAGEMSAQIAKHFGAAADNKFYLFPISTSERVAAVIYADGSQKALQHDALELLATLAGILLERVAGKAGDGLVSISATHSSGEDDLHRKAKRFARVRVAEIRLHQDLNVKNGRAGRDLYGTLKVQIDSAREAYRSEFLGGSEDMEDYLHQELVHTLAQDDVELLGPEYPGPLA